MTRLLYGKPIADELARAVSQRAAACISSGVTPCLAVVRVFERGNDVAYENAIERCARSVGVTLRREHIGVSESSGAFDSEMHEPPGAFDSGMHGRPGISDSKMREQSGASDSLIAAGIPDKPHGAMIRNPSVASLETELYTILRTLASDPAVHGILLLRPLPEGMDEATALAEIPLGKDIDGVTQAQMAALYSAHGDFQVSGVLNREFMYESNSNIFFPCTAEAVIRMLDHYEIPIARSRAVVIGRSTVTGKPTAQLLLARDATVTICHSKTPNLAAVTREADIVVVCAGLARKGRAHRLDAAYFSQGQTIIDVAVNFDAEGLYGDVDMDAVSGMENHNGSAGSAGDSPGNSVSALTPVPGGLGAVTTLVLIEHVIRAAEESRNKREDQATHA
ncbi:MAG: bifunctional 5,10-methylenetetrahydrofolate dehydrogenase/5,10-methenyltetrahydrofolate cyclohydrolase [Clostridiales Family XIII bacterium]|jgi:methylenetetrahydrofolate dehydrogenase (NADP+)/methenyltetrahydrofolate cyclohydrolase|nr:bifunctional 5,10-methylenetetrahydrofolate dehydrogenase/5,10-methenyltetrahydrofolate cyclohydrolase [Clostridiales Family XIII bacterium]